MKPADFISRLVMHFPVRHESEEREAEWTKSMVDAIAFYDGETLRRSAQYIIDTRTDRRFPLPAEIRKVCASIVHEIKASTPQLGGKKPESGGRYDSLADELIHGPMGREAARDGWIGILHGFIAKHGRLPNPVAGEVAWCKREAKDFDGAYDDCLRSLAGPLSKQLAELGGKMLANRERLRGIVLGDAA